ncbi:hypothetical protein PBY51_008778 [Eleginops maclovinus]|uniref:Unique cartilage matrix-associated protein n=1 Tax=Eleginops maclovinus TaxID=56733 RepID=A0AAN7WSX5_ELEMC|nr:hypothetical protein PBY51_008778 [Eleginops maclovinus]
MSWTRVFVLSLLPALLLLHLFSGAVESKAVKDHSKPRNHKGAARQVFLPESDASSFIKRRSRRSTRYYEIQVEQRVKIAASEQRREYNEEQRDEYEHYVKEERDEQNERSRETNEQYREYHYDGLSPQYYWFH